jgi:hypothetical protein
MAKRRIERWWIAGTLVALGAAGMAPGFGCGGTEGTGAAQSTSSSSGSGGAGGHGGQGGDGGSFTVATGTGGAATVACTVPCDAATQICSHGVCVPLVPCKSDNECANDTTCDPKKGCQPWEGQTPAHDATCVNVIAPGILSPKVKCEFSQAPADDPFQGHVDVQGTPIVINFNNPSSSGPPSIAASFTTTIVNNYAEDNGVIRILKGTDCSLEQNLGGTDVDGDGVVDWTVSSASIAAGDLDGDGSAEIVAYGNDGSTLAFTRKSGAWALLWKAPFPAGAPWAPCVAASHRCSLGWAGPSLYDLDDDGKPEVVREGVVFGSDGALKSLAPPGYASYSQGLFSVAANLDQDPAVEFTNGQNIWEWQAGAWVKDPNFPGTSAAAPGHVAVADFGAYGANVPATNPEIVVVRNNYVMVYAVDGTFAQPPVSVPGAGGGGPPTVADFDGDGLPEVAVAGQAFYTIYDIDCGPSPRPGGKCLVGKCGFLGSDVDCTAGSYIAWSRASQDLSSNVTGSSVFDFEADGTSEVVYADECFVRVYNGKSGEVLFSQYRSSCTWYENPIIADVDGNFRADLITPSNKACAPTSDGLACKMLDANGVDSLFAGLRCQTSADCISGTCDAGLCRCTASAQCCGAKTDAACLEEGYKCAPPPAGTAGAGDTCRANHPHGVSGIRVYSDANDKWVRSRTVWNQHPYAVTHINEDGTVPKTSQWVNNWETPKLNNFRTNVPGTQNGLSTGDTTAGAADKFTCTGASVTLSSPICNRGADPIGPGLSVGFYVGGAPVCSTKTTKPLAPEECENVTCEWATPPTTDAAGVDVTVFPNDDGAYAECKSGNNKAVVHHVFCKPAG